MKRLGVGVAVFLFIVLLVPSVIILMSDKTSQPQQTTQTPTQQQIPLPKNLENQISVSVYRTESKKVEVYPIEQYIVGVVSAEMPAEFEVEALKAQAMAARTYIIRRISEKNFSDVPQGAYVTDTIKHQVFMDDSQLKETWGSDYDWKIQRVREAVVGTQGKVLTYDGKPIDATFFSTSNGYTENSEEYWKVKIPYLRSVKVPWDKESPKYTQEVEIGLSDLEKKLGVKISAAASTGAGQTWSKIMDKTTGGRIGKIEVGNKTFTGREIRDKLELPSSAFQWSLKNGKVLITTFGYGHGVGMSQWGANGMAKDGKKADDIVKYFYQGIAIDDYHKWLKAGG